MINCLNFRFYLITVNIVLLLIFLNWINCLGPLSFRYDFKNGPSVVACVLFTKNVISLIISRDALILPYLWDIGVLSSYSILNYILKGRQCFFSNFLGNLFFFSVICSNPFKGIELKFQEGVSKSKAFLKEYRRRKLERSKKSLKKNEEESAKVKDDDSLSKTTQTENHSQANKSCQFPNFDSAGLLKSNSPFEFINNNIEKFITEHSIQTSGFESGDFEGKPEKQILLNSIKAQAHKNLGLQTSSKIPNRRKDLDVVNIEDLMPQKSCNDVKSVTTSAVKTASWMKKNMAKGAAVETIFMKRNGFMSNSEISTRKSERLKHSTKKIVNTDSGYQF